MNPLLPLREALERILGKERVLSAVEDIIPYGYDGTPVLKQRPGLVVFPHSTEEVSTILREAAKAKVPVVTRGSGTGLSGGSVPVEGALVLVMTDMRRILELDADNLTLRAEAGVVTQRIFDAADQAGLFYPPDPSSMRISTIGGNVSENSGGLRGLKYGVTRDYVMGLQVVLADGTICALGNKCVKDVAGYNLRDLFIGSEGTLGVVTEVLLKLLPKPEARATLLASFRDLESAAETVSAIISAKIVPCTMEFLDRNTIRCVEDYAHVGLPTEAGAILLIETDGHPAAVADEIARIERICVGKMALEVRRAASSEEALKLATARRSALSALARVKPTTILEDVTVPRNQLARMVRFVEAVAAKHRVQVATFGHFGDGNLHPTFLTNEKDKDEMHRVEQALAEIFEEALRLGGTITGEHGVGLAKKPYLRRQLGEAQFELLRRIKSSLDPEKRLNPGKIFD